MLHVTIHIILIIGYLYLYDKMNHKALCLVLTNDLFIGGQTDDFTMNKFLFCSYIKQIESMRLWVCTVGSQMSK